MKTSLWKIILVFGAILVGAALVLPKAFRDKSEKTTEQVLVSTQMVSPDGETLGGVKPVIFGFHEVRIASVTETNQCVEGKVCPPGTKAYLSESYGYLLLVEKPILSAADLKRANVGLKQQTHAPIVNFSYTAVGRKKFCDFTAAHIDEPFAIVLNGEIIAAPTILSPICGGSGYVEGNFTVKEAQDLALALNAGTIPPKQRVVD